MGWQWWCTYPKCKAGGFVDSKEEAVVAEADHYESAHGTPKWRWN